MPSITLERSTTADRAQHAAAASSPSVPFPTFESDSEEDTSSSSAAVSKRGRNGKAPLRAVPPAIPARADESDLSDDGGADVEASKRLKLSKAERGRARFAKGMVPVAQNLRPTSKECT